MGTIFSKITHEVADPSFESRLDNPEEFKKPLLDGSVNEPFKKKKDVTFVHRLEIADSLYYLKRDKRKNTKQLIRSLLKGRRLHTDSVWEYYAIRELQSCDLNIMNPVLCGEEMFLGFWPVQGYLLVEAVEGKEVFDVFLENGDRDLQNALLHQMGYFLGKMHGKGYFHSPRIHDFLYQINEETGKYNLVMIDVDFKGMSPRPRPFDSARALEALSHSFYLFLRSGHTITPRGINRFMTAYLAELHRATEIRPKPDCLKSLEEMTNRKLREHNKIVKTKEYLSPLPDSLDLLLSGEIT